MGFQQYIFDLETVTLADCQYYSNLLEHAVESARHNVRLVDGEFVHILGARYCNVMKGK